MLRENKEFYPFGMAINNDGEATCFGYKDEETVMPQSQKVIDELTKIYQKKLNNNDIRAYGLAYDTRVIVNDEGDKSDAILIDILHRDSRDIPKYCFTYSWSEKDELIFGESFGIKR
jgi:hypothetical protein